tara:strand:- start:336 stop:518 length:183 start_codon:yes stop_codon:yes gene_type:complete
LVLTFDQRRIPNTFSKTRPIKTTTSSGKWEFWTYRGKTYSIAKTIGYRIINKGCAKGVQI